MCMIESLRLSRPTINEQAATGPVDSNAKLTVMVLTLLMHQHTPCARGHEDQGLPRVEREL